MWGVGVYQAGVAHLCRRKPRSPSAPYMRMTNHSFRARNLRPSGTCARYEIWGYDGAGRGEEDRALPSAPLSL